MIWSTSIECVVCDDWVDAVPLTDGEVFIDGNCTGFVIGEMPGRGARRTPGLRRALRLPGLVRGRARAGRLRCGRRCEGEQGWSGRRVRLLVAMDAFEIRAQLLYGLV